GGSNPSGRATTKKGRWASPSALFFARCRSVRGRWRTARSGLHAAVDFGAGAADVHAAMRLGASAAGAVADADLVAHVAHAGAAVGQALGAMLHPALRDHAAERGDAVAHLDGDVAGVQVVRFGEPLVQVLADAFVRARIVARADTAVTAACTEVAAAAADLVVTAAAVVALEVATAALAGATLA